MTEQEIDPDTAYILRKTYRCPPQQLYDAFLDASVLKKIWGLKSITIDNAIVGGTASATMPEEYQQWNFTLTYKEIDPPHCLRWYSHFPAYPSKETRATLNFRAVDGGTELTFAQKNFETSEERDANRQANKGALERLEGLLK